MRVHREHVEPIDEWEEEITDTEIPDIVATLGRPCLVALTGVNAGEAYPLNAQASTIGRAASSDIRLLGAGVSRRHCEIRRTPDGMLMEDVGSANGVIVNGVRVERAVLREGDKVFLGRTVFRYSVLDDLEETYQRRLYESALRDDLTSAYNKRYFRDHLDTELQLARRHASPLAVTMIDLDGLKRINDHHGHEAGDALLRTLAARIAETIRDHDIFARLGGDEFAVCSRMTSAAAALALADRVAAAARDLRFRLDGAVVETSASLGVATYPEVDAGTGVELLGAADTALYSAKHAGRNRVELASQH